MSLSFLRPGKSFEARWITYALLRDNVQHHLEEGLPSSSFSALHHISEALGGRRIIIPARQLHEEAQRARVALIDKSVDELAVSARTEAVMSLTWPPRTTGTRIVGTAVVPHWLAGKPTRLRDVFGGLLDAILEITAGVTNEDTIEIVDT